MGAADAPVKLVEFSDFQCPFCASLKPALARILEKYPAEVAIVYRHFPLQRIHPHAFEAARASECASAQGRFRQYHDALYARQVAIGVMSWGDFAEAAGVPDLRGFRSCMADTAHAGAVRTDLATATELGLRGTPTIILDGYVLTGPGLADLERRVDRAVRATRRD
jgi:protein-disulfide isomerase